MRLKTVVLLVYAAVPLLDAVFGRKGVLGDEPLGFMYAVNPLFEKPDR